MKLLRKLRPVLDVSLLVGFAITTYLFPFEPIEKGAEAVRGPALRVAFTILVGARIFAWVVPRVLDLLEGFDFRALVSSRHLRAKKSRFLAIISTLAI
ncbi:MAG: hypothetical protein KC416_02420, partial [Myxococcales bacterium]|nr:hypothetical protein [Myxococcales bacterium]